MQGPQGLSRERGGLGVGLTLVERIVRLHGGSVSAESDGTNRGSRFTVLLPIVEERAETLLYLSAAAVQVRPKRVNALPYSEPP